MHQAQTTERIADVYLHSLSDIQGEKNKNYASVRPMTNANLWPSNLAYGIQCKNDNF